MLCLKPLQFGLVRLLLANPEVWNASRML